MKKIQILFMLLSFAVIANAQYKKASFFTKGGRTYTLGATTHIMGDGKGAPIGFFFSGGKDNTEKRLFRWYEFVVLPAFTYSYQTMGINNTNYSGPKEPVTVSGKTKMHIIYNFNVGYHLLDRSEGEKKLTPYVFAGLNLVVFGGSNYAPAYDTHSELDKNVSLEAFSAGIRAGAGTLLNFTDKLALKLDVGYNIQFNKNRDGYNNGTQVYYAFTNHILVSSGIRFRFIED